VQHLSATPHWAVQVICPHCSERVGPTDLSVDFTICLTCREIIRLNDQLQPNKMYCQDWLDLSKEKKLFVAMLRWRMNILLKQLKERSCNNVGV